MKTKQRTLLGLLVLVLLLGGALALLTRQNQKAEQAASEAAQGAIPLSSFAADDLTEIVVTYNGETIRAITYTLDFYLPDYDMAIDTKGVATQQGKLRIKMLKRLFADLGRTTTIELPRTKDRACGSADRKPINKSYDPISLHRPLLRCRWYQHGR